MICRPALCALVLLTGCSIDEPVPSSGCDQLSDCELDQVCDVTINQCIPEPDNRILGAFRCEVIDRGVSSVTAGSEIIGRVGTDNLGFPVVRAAFSSGADCRVRVSQTEPPELVISAPDFSGSFGVVLTLALEDTLGNQRIPIDVHAPPISRNSGELVDLRSDERIGTTVGGFAFIEPPVVGSVVEGFLDLDMIETVNVDGIVGVPCPRGIADCGRAQDGPFMTLCAPRPSPEPSICAATCDADADCQAFDDAICVPSSVGDICTRSCTADSECLSPLFCQTVGGRGACL